MTCPLCGAEPREGDGGWVRRCDPKRFPKAAGNMGPAEHVTCPNARGEKRV